MPEETKEHLSGLCANEKELFVADPTASAIKVFDRESMRLVRSWRTERVGPLALDATGVVWLLQRKTENAPAILEDDYKSKVIAYRLAPDALK